LINAALQQESKIVTPQLQKQQQELQQMMQELSTERTKLDEVSKLVLRLDQIIEHKVPTPQPQPLAA